MFDIYKKIQKIEVDGKTFDNICATYEFFQIITIIINFSILVFQLQTFFKQRKEKRDRYEEIIRIINFDLIFLQTEIGNDDTTDNAAYEYEEYDFWSDEYDEYPEDNEIVKTVQRINFLKYGNKSSNKEAALNTVDSLPDNIYCDLVTTLNEKCILTNLLEIWRYNEEHIRTATQQEIIDAVNLLTKSPWFGYEADYEKFLGGIERNSSGHIVSAQTANMIWKLKLPEDIELVDNQGSGLELELADKTTLAWEEKFVQIVQNMSKPDAIALPHAAKSFGDISSKAIFFDAYLMAGGYLLMFAYTIFMLGKLNTLEVRLFLSISGIVSIFMGLGIALSLSSLLGYPFTPMHAALPFLCLGESE